MAPNVFSSKRASQSSRFVQSGPETWEETLRAEPHTSQKRLNHNTSANTNQWSRQIESFFPRLLAAPRHPKLHAKIQRLRRLFLQEALSSSVRKPLPTPWQLEREGRLVKEGSVQRQPAKLDAQGCHLKTLSNAVPHS